MIDLMKRLAELCPEWCEFVTMDDEYGSSECLKIVPLTSIEAYLDPAWDDTNNAPANFAIVERMIAEGKHPKMYFEDRFWWVQHRGKYRSSVNCAATLTEAILKAATEAFGEGKE